MRKTYFKRRFPAAVAANASATTVAVAAKGQIHESN